MFCHPIKAIMKYAKKLSGQQKENCQNCKNAIRTLSPIYIYCKKTKHLCHIEYCCQKHFEPRKDNLFWWKRSI